MHTHLLIKFIGDPCDLSINRSTHHNKTVTDPQRRPAIWTIRNVNRLTVDRYHSGRDFTYDTFTDIRLDVLTRDGFHGHGHGLWGRQPVGIPIAGCHMTHVVDVAEHVWHGTESGQTASGGTCEF